MHTRSFLIYVFGVFLSILTFFDKAVRSIFLEFLYIVEGGGTPVKRTFEGLF